MGDYTSIRLGGVDMGQNQVKNLPDPVDPGDSINKAVSDKTVQVSDSKQSVKVSSTTALPTCTYDSVAKTLTASVNGVLPTTWCYSYALSIGDRVLLLNQVSLPQNGIYDVIDLGSASTPWILQRSNDFDANDEIVGGVVYEEYTQQLFIVTSVEPFTLDTSDITFKTSTSGLIISQSKTVTSGTYNALLADKPVIFFDTSGGNSTINGFTGGVAGQQLEVIKSASSKSLTFAYNNANGTQKLRTKNAGNLTFANGAFGIMRLVCDGTYWYTNL